MKETNTAHLAGEFLVAGELARRGYPVSITMGNAKSVDIYAGTRIMVDAKAGRTKSNWPVKKHSIQPNVFYVFVYLGTEKEIKNDKPPEYFIVTGKEIISQELIQEWGSRSGITYKDLEKFKGKWHKIPAIK